MKYLNCLKGVTPWDANFLINGVKYVNGLEFYHPKMSILNKSSEISQLGYNTDIELSYCSFYVYFLTF